MLLALQSAYSAMRERTLDRLYRSEVVLWARDIQLANPGLVVPPIPSFSADQVAQHTRCVMRGTEGEAECYIYQSRN